MLAAHLCLLVLQLQVYMGGDSRLPLSHRSTRLPLITLKKLIITCFWVARCNDFVYVLPTPDEVKNLPENYCDFTKILNSRNFLLIVHYKLQLFILIKSYQIQSVPVTNLNKVSYETYL